MKTKKHISKSRYQKWQESNSEVNFGEIPRYLYHGTNDSSAMTALREGLCPRMERTGNFAHFPSNPDAVYLTDSYGPYFAASASLKRGGCMAIMEVKTTIEMIPRFIPDEDYLEQQSRRSWDLGEEFRNWDIFQKTEFFRKNAQSRFSVFWSDSLRHFGTVAHIGPIASKTITRVAIIDVEKLAWIPSYSGSIPIALEFHKENSARQRSLTRWIFGEGVSRKEVFGEMKLNEPGRKLLLKRDGIEIISNTCDLPYAA